MRLLLCALMTSFLAGCASMGTCKDPYVSAPRKPASTCDILMPRLVRTHGKWGYHNYLNKEEHVAKLKARGYNIIQPELTDSGIVEYLEKIPDGGYGLMFDAWTSLVDGGKGGGLLIRRDGEILTLVTVVKPIAGYGDAIRDSLDQLPMCGEAQAPKQ